MVALIDSSSDKEVAAEAEVVCSPDGKSEGNGVLVAVVKLAVEVCQLVE